MSGKISCIGTYSVSFSLRTKDRTMTGTIILLKMRSRESWGKYVNRHKINYLPLMRQLQQKSSAFLVCWNVLEASMANSVDSSRLLLWEQSVLGPRCLLLYLIHRKCKSIICSRRLQQTTFSVTFFLGALRVKLTACGVICKHICCLLFIAHLRMMSICDQRWAFLISLYPGSVVPCSSRERSFPP